MGLAAVVTAVCGERCLGIEVAVFLQSVEFRALVLQRLGCFLPLIAQRLSRRAPW